MLQSLQQAPSPASSAPCPARPAPRSAPRLRALFLRHFRACGEVRQAAKQAGIARSTLYRWRENDARFRARWETYDEMRRHEAEDHLVRLMREGEKTTAFYKGESVGWKVNFTVRPAVALLASQDRREKLRLRERERDAKRASVSHSGDRLSPDSPAASIAWPKERRRKNSLPSPVPTPQTPGPTEQPPGGYGRCGHGRDLMTAEGEEHASVSHSEARFPSEKRSFSKAWSEKARRKEAPFERVPHRLQDGWGLPKTLGDRGHRLLVTETS